MIVRKHLHMNKFIRQFYSKELTNENILSSQAKKKEIKNDYKYIMGTLPYVQVNANTWRAF